MIRASRTAQIENLVGELTELYLAQAADLREYTQATAAVEGTVYLERSLRPRKAQWAEVYRRFERAAFPLPQRQTALVSPGVRGDCEEKSRQRTFGNIGRQAQVSRRNCETGSLF